MIAGLAEQAADRNHLWQKKVIQSEATIQRLAHKYRSLLVSGVCLFYLVPTIELARRKLIWTDEFFTLYLSRLSPQQLWAALLTGGDQHPPGFYLLHHLALRTLGETALALRLPAMLGFLLMTVSLYGFVTKRTSVAYGLVAMLIPLATIAHEFAYEARGYSFLLGFIALTVFGWQQVDGGKIKGALIMALGLTGGVLSHYYMILVLPAIAAAELVRSVRLKSWNIWVWLTMCVPIILLVICFPLLKAASSFAPTFWGKASLGEVGFFYENVLGSAATCLLVSVSIAGLYLLISNRAGTCAFIRNKTFPPEEVVLGVALAAFPLIAYLFGEFATGVFVWRYAIGALVGFAILFGFLCFRLFRGSAIAAGLIGLVLAMSFAVTARIHMRMLSDRHASFRGLMAWLAHTGSQSEPMIIGDSQTFYTLSYYSPPQIKDRYLYLVDSQRSLKYLGQDTPDRSLSTLNRWFGLNVEDYSSYTGSHRQMQVWIPPNEKWIWLLPALIDDGRKVTVADRLGTSILFSATAPEIEIGH